MAFDFPASPTVGQTFTPAGGPTYTWDGVAWGVMAPPVARSGYLALNGLGAQNIVLPADTQGVDIGLYNVSHGGASGADLFTQLLDGTGTAIGTGYAGSIWQGNSSNVVSSTSYYQHTVATTAVQTFSGMLHFRRLGPTGTIWAMSGILGMTSAGAVIWFGQHGSVPTFGGIRFGHTGNPLFDAGAIGWQYW